METLEQQFNSRVSAFLSRTGHETNDPRHEGGGRPESDAPDRTRALAIAEDGGPGSGLNRRTRPGRGRRTGPAAPPWPSEVVVRDGEDRRNPNESGTADGTDREQAGPHSAVAGGGDPHGSVAQHDLQVAGRFPPPVRALTRTLRFEFLDSVPPELVVHNPMGILITCLQADLALVTGESP